ncbi:chromosome segregation protein SMC [Gracilimonas mengyeensis]|uniref:Chromosome partition protein Smc n=1 Tax=Gracilimonas mengyeensis TaxID=1302730 RepID=A0A521DFG3_9BACT|nr:chromosome segregation protein SMC [Gracilimonas mengyeensis]SMO70447.1 condensin subunit Smc [Gracilimonas mengyeensis]
MYISELELQGFKSFAHKTKVKFDSGITSIVGPNGCGKSNIVDALRWVLGEQRPSLLRSSAMANVIFNGTAQKKALGMAEVSLTFVNDKGILPIEYSEVTITRRLYRSGDSEYLINGTTCRLKDIMELFMDTGMGSDAYSVIELKMVEEILNDKNNDRRRLFEEAAGVTKYKDQRKKTIRKLESTRKDLQRVDDLLIELRKKARSLEIQAEKAQKAKVYKDELEQLDKALTLHDFNKIKDELEPLKERIANADKEKKEIAKAIEELEENDEKARAELVEKERQQAEAQRRVSQLHNTLREADTNLRITREKIENEKKVIAEYGKDIESGEKDLKELKDLLESSRDKLEGYDDEMAKSVQALEDSKKKYNQIQQQYNRERSELYEIEVELSAANNELSQLQTKRIKIESRLENTEGDLERIDDEITDLNDEIENLNGEQGLIEKKLDKLVVNRDELEEELETAREKREQFADKQNEIKDELRTLQSKKESLESEINLMNDLAASNEAFPGSVKYLIENHRFDFKEMTTVSEIFNTDQEHAVALEAVLGDVLNFVVVKTLDEAQRAAKILKDNEKGRATFIPLDQLAATYPVKDGSLFDEVKSKRDHSALKQLLLGNVLVFDSVEEAYQGTKNQDDVVGVTYDGEVVTDNKFFQSGSKSKNAGIRVGLKDKIEKLEKEEAKVSKEITKLEEYLQQIVEKYEKLDIGKLSQMLKEKEQEVRRLEQQQQSLSSKVSVYQKNIGELVNRKDHLKSSEGTAQEELNSIQPKQKELQQKMLALDEKQQEKKDLLETLEEERSIAQSRYNDTQLKHQDLKNKVENLERDVQRAETGIENVKKRIENRTRLTEESKERIETLTSKTKELQETITTNSELKEKADETLKKAEEAAAKQRGKINEIEKELKEVRRRKEVNMELVHHLDMAREKMEMQSQTLSDHIWETYGVLMKQIDEELPEDKTPEEAKERISWLKQKLNRIGEVNPLAIEEYKEEKERLDFYEEQIMDLEEAEEQLLETIDEINETATERFNTTFERIRQNFQKVFKTLFEADDYCDLIIEQDVEDPLEARIEIKAQPRGKRPSGISQLSGGEKTLTAIALLFAIYLVKPSPFCVLDEVDAPLDDANIERFAKMIKDFSHDTQFIIITHNKKTMSKAEMMYGVTMPDTGVSRLVGVKLDEVEDVL